MVGMTHIYRKFQMQEVSVWVQFVPHIYRNGSIIPVDTCARLNTEFTVHVHYRTVGQESMFPVVLAWYFWKTVKISKPSTCFETIILCLFLNTFSPQYHSFKACTSMYLVLKFSLFSKVPC